MISVAALRALVAGGATAATIVDVVEAELATEQGEADRRRAQDAARAKRYRDKRVTQNHVTSRDALLLTKTLSKDSESKEGKEESKEEAVTLRHVTGSVPQTIPAGWRPNMTGIERADAIGLRGEALELEIERFVNWYMASGRQAHSWNALWVNWILSPSRKGVSNGTGFVENRRQRELSEWERTYAELDAFARGSGTFDQFNAPVFQAGAGGGTAGVRDGDRGNILPLPHRGGARGR